MGARTLTPRQKAWSSKLRHGELPWQQRIPGLRNAAQGPVLSRAVDSRVIVAQNLAAVTGALTAQGIEFVQLPQLSDFRPRLVVRQSDVPNVAAALGQLDDAEGWTITITRDGGKLKDSRWAATHPAQVQQMRARRRLCAPNEREMTTVFEDVFIEPWEELGEGIERVDGDFHIPGTLHRRISRRGTYVEYLTPDNWHRAVEDGGALRWSHPHLYQFTEPVDIVYTWVDGDDPAWQERKLVAEGVLDPAEVNETATITSRFTSRDELRYSLRSVEQFANWVNHIYIVTDRQVPEWLDVDHPKVTVIDHRDIFTDPEALPVFNSHAIESQLHHIPGLSEHYVYLNDDIFFMRPTEPTLFFTGNGQSKFFPSTAPLDIDAPSARDLPVLSAAKQNRAFMLNAFGRVVTNKFKHTPHSQLRSVLSEMEAKHEQEFQDVAASRFRHPDDLSITSALYHFYAYAAGRAQPGGIRYAYMDIAREDADLYLQRLARRTDLDVLCLNDTNTTETDEEYLTRILGRFLNSRFPIPSHFEKGVEKRTADFAERKRIIS
ncbi:stealth family protein [Brevibacterium sp. BRM-1]|uniref:stealth family protein n=1 Tax=Brevibacterium sp. BRM-1 TaxID=2999062 RepID=UPI002281D74C|nr:stealth family protein [Brevibacterium sp. BRM-1]WAL40104.1 stealth family protein [Brevibacterium sp. BRM-1]